MNEATRKRYEARRDELQATRDAIVDKSKPLREHREALVAKIQPLEAELRELDGKIKAIERPELADIDYELGFLAKGLGGKAMNADSQETAVEGSEVVVG